MQSVWSVCIKGVWLDIDCEHEGDGVILVHRIFIEGVNVTELLLDYYYEDIVEKLRDD